MGVMGAIIFLQKAGAFAQRINGWRRRKRVEIPPRLSDESIH